MADSRPKKGLDEMLPDELLIRAKRIAYFHSPDWPIEFLPDQVAALMAGGRQGEHQTEYSDAKRLVAEAIRAGRLSVRTVKIQGKSTMKDHVDEFGRRVGTFHIERSPDKTLYRVDRQACADWLNCRGAKPGRYPYIDEWLRTGGWAIGEANGRHAGQQTERAGKKTEVQQDRSDCQDICLALWKNDPTKTITGKNGVAQHNDLSAYSRKYSLEWVEGCAREVAPEQVKGRRGRRKKISDQTEK